MSISKELPPVIENQKDFYSRRHRMLKERKNQWRERKSMEGKTDGIRNILVFVGFNVAIRGTEEMIVELNEEK